MPKKVLDVGNCGPDHSAIRGLIERNFDADVAQAHGLEDTMELMQQSTFDLDIASSSGVRQDCLASRDLEHAQDPDEAPLTELSTP